MNTPIMQHQSQTNTELLLLGAGRPAAGNKHSALRSASENIRVLDWLLQATGRHVSKVNFVGGYQAEDIAAIYPEFQYFKNTRWTETGPAFSLLSADLVAGSRYLVSYSDILYRELISANLLKNEADIVVAIDSHWKHRYLGRTDSDIEQCEKVCTAINWLTSLGPDIPQWMANGEFVGLVLFSEKVVQYIIDQRSVLRVKHSNSLLSHLIEHLRVLGFSVAYVDVEGDWAELNDQNDVAHFVMGTKAQTLSRLQSIVTQSRIEDQVAFTVGEWLTKPDQIMSAIRADIAGENVVVRSSALSEDGFSDSMAGAYTSLLNISCETEQLSSAINSVIQSYPDENPHNQVLVQPMLVDVVASGVVFTRSLSTGAPYYVVNYDDLTGSTESITSGSSREDKTLIIRRDTNSDCTKIPENLTGLLPSVREIEKVLSYDSLDIEFAITHHGIHILQVRPIAVDHSTIESADISIIDSVKSAENLFESLQTPTPFICGEFSIFGIMPDWNPAEIIGTTPSLLASTLYSYLIMDETWATQRAEYGYRNVTPSRLLITFAGHPYVDIRASFNSFIPAAIDDELTGKLVSFYMSWLKKNPHLHDKVEFDVVPTCFGLDFDDWQKHLCKNGGFSREEVDRLGLALLDITKNAMLRVHNDLQMVEIAKKRYRKISEMSISQLHKAHLLLEDCRNYGTLPFAHLARGAFVAMTLLKSGVKSEVLSEEAMNDFLSTIETVSHSFTRDSYKTATGAMGWDEFVDTYGHLRPGTYDITSRSYRADAETYLRPLLKRAVAPADSRAGTIWESERDNFIAALNVSGIPGSTEEFESFFRLAIEGREYSKFVFTKSLSSALDAFVEYGEELGLSEDQLAQLDIQDLLDLRICSEVTMFRKQRLEVKSELARAQQSLAKSIELPPLLTGVEDFSVFMYPGSQPNYIGSKAIVADCIDLTEITNTASIDGKIVMIPQADPGYDWLFGRNISGLITKHGGANSHMAIRSAEFGLPAAIGVGESLFNKIRVALRLELDAGNRTIRII